MAWSPRRGRKGDRPVSRPAAEAHGLRKAFGEVQCPAVTVNLNHTTILAHGPDGHLTENLTPASGEPA